MNNLYIFIKVAETMNITNASKELFISQPAVSKALKNLEDMLHVRLFIRDKKQGLMLTDVGKDILKLARQMQSIEDKIYQIADYENNLIGSTVKIGSVPTVTANILPKVLATFRLQYPHVQIKLVEGSSNQIKEWVEDRVVDMGIVAAPFDSFESEALYTDHIVAVVPEDHRLSEENKINLRENQHELIFCKSGQEITLDKLYEKSHCDLKNNLIVQNTETLVRMVENKLGIGIISIFSLASQPHNLVVKAIHPPIDVDVRMITHSFEETTPATKAFIKAMSQCTSEIFDSTATAQILSKIIYIKKTLALH